MSRAAMFLVLAFVGLAAQIAIAAVFFADRGLDLGGIGDQATATTMAVLALVDLLLSAAVYLVWLPREARRVGIERWWPYALAVAGGLCFALPLFLAARERGREQAAA